MINGVLRTCTAYSRLTIISSLAISDNAADKQISARCVEAFGRNPGIGAAQHSGEWILSAGQRLALVSEIVPARYALHIAVVAFHQTIERRIRCDDFVSSAEFFGVGCLGRGNGKSGGQCRKGQSQSTPSCGGATAGVRAKFAHVIPSANSNSMTAIWPPIGRAPQYWQNALPLRPREIAPSLY
jgi:hypothetical protein